MLSPVREDIESQGVLKTSRLSLADGATGKRAQDGLKIAKSGSERAWAPRAVYYTRADFRVVELRD
jgi:hypothetical protein